MEEKFKFEFNFFELNSIIKGLKELSYKESHVLIQKIVDEYEALSKKDKKKD
jgi:hypothetical protein